MVQRSLALRRDSTWAQVLADVGPFLLGLSPHLGGNALRRILTLAILHASGATQALPTYALRAGEAPPPPEAAEAVRARALHVMQCLPLAPPLPSLVADARPLVHEVLLTERASFVSLCGAVSPHFAPLTACCAGPYRRFYSTILHALTALGAVEWGGVWQLGPASAAMPSPAAEAAWVRARASAAPRPPAPEGITEDADADPTLSAYPSTDGTRLLLWVCVCVRAWYACGWADV